MNCKPGDLAVIVNMPLPCSSLVGMIVRLRNEPPFQSLFGPAWTLDQPLVVRLSSPCRSASGVDFAAGELGYLVAVPDHYLRPIRDPGPDAVDEMLLLAGKPDEVHT